MSLLTKEQLQIVNGIKAMIADCDYKTDQIRGLFDLVSIIDDLQARAPRQYTEQELREAFEREIDKESGYASPMHFHCDLDIWMQCARFLGALKAEP